MSIEDINYLKRIVNMLYNVYRRYYSFTIKNIND